MPMYNLLEYNQNFAWHSEIFNMTPGSLWSYYRDEIDEVDDNASDSKSFNSKTKIVGKTQERQPQPDPDEVGSQPPQPSVSALNDYVFIPLKYLSNF